MVTGGAGFIGHNTALYLAERGYEVLVVDSLERSTRLALERLSRSGIRVVRDDVRDPVFLTGYLENGDVVVHAAAYISVEESVASPERYLENNVLGTLNVARACLRKGASLVFLSSASVYGTPLKLPIGEDHPTKPLSPYGLSKLFGELLLELYGRDGLRYTILRLFNVYGPGQTGPYAGVISRFIESALKREKLVVFGDGTQTRDFVNVLDVARAVELAITSQVYGEVFNIGSGRATSINELASLVKSLLCGECSVEYKPPRPGDIKHSYADIRKVREKLGYNPRITLEEGLRELVKFYTAEGYAVEKLGESQTGNKTIS